MDIVHWWRDAHHDPRGLSTDLAARSLVSNIRSGLFKIMHGLPHRCLSFVHNWYLLSRSLSYLLYLIVYLTVRSFSVVLWAEIVEGARRYFPWAYNWVAITLTHTIWASQALDCASGTLPQEIVWRWAMLCGDWEVLLSHTSTVIVADSSLAIRRAIAIQDIEDELARSTFNSLINFGK